MKRGVWLGWLVALCLWPAAPAQAQVRVELRMSHENLLQFEPVSCIVTIRNDFGSHMEIDAESEGADARLDFVIACNRNRQVRRINSDPLIKYLRVPPDQKRDVMRDLSLWYDFSPVGNYTVIAELTWGGRVYESRKVRVNVVRGIEVARTEKWVPGQAGRVRSYALKYWFRDREERLFLCVDEPESGWNYGVFDLGRLVRIFKPVVEVDRHGMVKVVHQSARGCFTRSLFKCLPEEVQFVSQTYHRPDGSPYGAAVEAPAALTNAPPLPPAKRSRSFWGWLRGLFGSGG